MSANGMKGITVKVDAKLHAEVTEYIPVSYTHLMVNRHMHYLIR